MVPFFVYCFSPSYLSQVGLGGGTEGARKVIAPEELTVIEKRRWEEEKDMGIFGAVGPSSVWLIEVLNWVTFTSPLLLHHPKGEGEKAE